MIYREENGLCRITESTTGVDRAANIEGGRGAMQDVGAVCPVCHKPTSTWSLVSRFPTSHIFCSQCRALLRVTAPSMRGAIALGVFAAAMILTWLVLTLLSLQGDRVGLWVVPVWSAFYLAISWVLLRAMRSRFSLALDTGDQSGPGIG
jgi:hypothetical protein